MQTVTSGSSAGFSLLEALISLAIIALVLGIGVTALRGPSPAMRLEQRASDLINQAAIARAQAVTTGNSVTLELPGCDGAMVSLEFYRDGTARGQSGCIEIDDLILKLQVSPLTGRLRVLRDL